jgi:aryl-alcohol dehydrogenase
VRRGRGNLSLCDSDPQSFIPELIAHHATGRFPFDKLIQTFPLAEINEVLGAQARGECIKVVLIP